MEPIPCLAALQSRLPPSIRRIISYIFLCLLCLLVLWFGLYVVIESNPPSMSVASASLAAVNVSSSSISGSWDISLDFHNPNIIHFLKVDNSFTGVMASLYYNGARLSQTSLPPFMLSERRTLRTTLAASGVYVLPSIIDALNAERNASGSINFKLRFQARAHYRPRWRPTRRFNWCHRISFTLLSGTNASLGVSEECGKDVGTPMCGRLPCPFTEH